MKIAIGADHGGFDLKEAVRAQLRQRGIEVEDVGCFDKRSVDYPDYAGEVAARVASRAVPQGILICTTGIGMSIAANRFPAVRAALCTSPAMAEKAREHTDANVLVMGGAQTSPVQAAAIVDAWLSRTASSEERHRRRVGKLAALVPSGSAQALALEDPEIAAAVSAAEEYERRTINLIASENYASRAVREAQGSVLTNKYAEGYPGKRWYNGCRFADAAESLAIERARSLFGADHVNVQPHSGSTANMAVYFAALKPGDAILAMSLAHGGHLTHGHSVNFSGRYFNVSSYGVGAETGRIDYGEVARKAKEHRPKLIVAGASAYSRIFDFERFREIADSVGALLMVDMAHIAGLVAGGSHPSPVPYADFVTSTTHKTLRGPRSGIVLCRAPYAAEIDRQVFPGLQGGPLVHVVAAKAVCFHEARRPEFSQYACQIVANARAMADALLGAGFRLISGGTDNHLMLVDLTETGITGRDAANALESAGIIANKNAIPFDTKSPFLTSGIRLGTPAVTTRGMKEAEMREIAEIIADVLHHVEDESRIASARSKVEALAAAFPVPA